MANRQFTWHTPRIKSSQALTWKHTCIFFHKQRRQRNDLRYLGWLLFSPPSLYTQHAIRSVFDRRPNKWRNFFVMPQTSPIVHGSR